METTNFKRRGAALCSHGHLHRNPDDARMCDVAHRHADRKRLHTDELVAQLRAVVFKNK